MQFWILRDENVTEIAHWMLVASRAPSRGMAAMAAVAQMSVTSDLAANIAQANFLVEKARAEGASMVFLPEAADFIGESREQTSQLSQPVAGSTVTAFREMAQRHGLWLSLGGLHIREKEGEKTSNTHLLVNSDGEIVATYAKTHLFDACVPGKFNLKESDYVAAGTSLTPPIETPLGRLGLGICYDLRFGEHSQALARAGAQILTFPSAFTVATGQAHWEALLRARAIETQSYVIAAAQTGQHNPKRSSYGHAMIVDPWGVVAAEVKEGVGVALAEIDLEKVGRIRREMPVQEQRRPELYGQVEIRSLKNRQDLPEDDEIFNFGPTAKVRGASTFHRTPLSLAFVNKKPVVEGHVLVVPRRAGVARLEELEEKEVTDLFLLVQRVDGFLQKHYGVDSTTISIQNGAGAGQTIPHLHVHILPRRPGDFSQNDDVYTRLAEHDKEKGGWRGEDVMAHEAAELREAWLKLMS